MSRVAVPPTRGRASMILSISIAALAAGTSLSCQDHAVAVGPRLLPDFIEARAAIEDAYVVGATPNLNTGSLQVLRLEGSDRRILVRFDQAEIAAIVGGDSLAGAVLQLTITALPVNWTAPYQWLSLHRVTQSWTEAGATWNCAVDAEPGNGTQDCVSPNAWVMGTPESSRPFDATQTASAPINNGTSGVIQFNVTADVRAFLAGTPNRGWLLKKLDENQEGQVSFGSKESATKPQLFLGIVQGDTSRPAIPITDYVPVPADSARVIASVSSTAEQFYRDLFDVRFDDTTSGTRVRSFLARYGAQLVGGVPAAKQYTIRIPDPGPLRASRDSLFQLFDAEPGVTYVAPIVFKGGVIIIRGRYPSDDPARASRSSWFTSDASSWARQATDLPLAWGCENGQYGPTARVGVVDYVFSGNPDLDSNVTGSHQLASGIGLRGDPILLDATWKTHGTAVAGILAARGGNGIGVAGVMWTANLELFWLSNGVERPIDVPRYIANVVLPKATNLGVRALNFSADAGYTSMGRDAVAMRKRMQVAIRDYLAGGNLLVYAMPNAPLTEPMQYYADVGDVVQGAIANMLAMGDPLAQQGVILVVGSKRGNTHRPSSASIVGNITDVIAAPAESVLTLNQSSGVTYGTGNSFAAPQVTGAIGLLLASDPTLNAAAIKSSIIESARDTGTSNQPATPVAGTPAGVTVYQLNVYKALRRLSRTRPDAPICGFIVRRGDDWASVVLERPGMSAESLPVPQTTSGVYGVSVAQGGRLIAIHDYDANGQITRLIDHNGVSKGTRPYHRVFLERDTAEVRDTLDAYPGYVYQVFRIHRADGSSSSILNPYQGLVIEYYFSSGISAVSPDASTIAITVVGNCVSGCSVRTTSYVVPIATMQRVMVADDPWSFCLGGPNPCSYPQDPELVWTHDARRVVFLRTGQHCTPPNCSHTSSVTMSDPSGNHASAFLLFTWLKAPRFTADDSVLVVGSTNTTWTTCEGQHRAVQAPFGIIRTVPMSLWYCRPYNTEYDQPNLRASPLILSNSATSPRGLTLYRPSEWLLARTRRAGVSRVLAN